MGITGSSVALSDEILVVERGMIVVGDGSNTSTHGDGLGNWRGNVR